MKELLKKLSYVLPYCIGLVIATMMSLSMYIHTGQMDYVMFAIALTWALVGIIMTVLI